MSEFITFYVETAKNELKERGFIKKSDINFLRTSDRYDDCYFTRLSNINETLYIKKTDFNVEAKPKVVKLPITDEGLKDYIPLSKPQQEYYNIAIDEAIITDEEWKIKNPYAQVSSRMNYTTWLTIKECINLLETDGKGTKQQVKERLEELIKDER